MTETQSYYTTPGNHNLKIPSRQEFHRYATNLLSESDFCTDYPSEHTINKIASSLRWTKINAKNKQWQVWPKQRGREAVI